jgi:16S rRNA (cytosine967-C5)-methyltransferase
MNDTGRIYAVERSAARLELLDANRRRLRHTSLVPVLGDVRHSSWAQRIPPERGGGSRAPICDRILVDAPCSGLGVLRRHPEAKWRKRSQELERHQALQIQIIESAASCLRPGGVLVYSTCSTEAEENEDVVEHFLRGHPQYRRDSVMPWLPARGRGFVTERGDFSTIANQDCMDAFYAARLTHVGA